MLFYRTLVHALVILLCASVLSVLSDAAHIEGLKLVLALFDASHYLLFSFAAAAALNRQRALVLVLLVVAVIFTWPPDTERIVHVLLPIGAGVLVGTAAQQLRSPQELYDRPFIQKFWKYAMTSVVGVVMGVLSIGLTWHAFGHLPA